MIDAQLAVLNLKSERVAVDEEHPADPFALPASGPPPGVAEVHSSLGRVHDLDHFYRPLTFAEAAERNSELRETLEWWKKHNEEWGAVGQEMIAAGMKPTAEEITIEQYRRMNDRGESPFEARRKIERLR